MSNWNVLLSSHFSIWNIAVIFSWYFWKFVIRSRSWNGLPFLFFDWNLNFYFIGTKSHWKTNRLLKWKILIQALKIMFGQDPDWSHFFGNNFHFLSSWVRLRCWKALCTLQLSSLRTLPKTTIHFFDLHSKDRQAKPWRSSRAFPSLQGCNRLKNHHLN